MATEQDPAVDRPIFRTPRFRGGVPPMPDIRAILATPDPGLWDGVRRHAAAAGVKIIITGEGHLLDLIRARLEPKETGMDPAPYTRTPTEVATLLAPVDRLPDDAIDALGLMLVVDDVIPDGRATLVSLTLGCPICEIAARGPDASLEGVEPVLLDAACARDVVEFAGEKYTGDRPSWSQVIAYLRDYRSPPGGASDRA